MPLRAPCTNFWFPFILVYGCVDLLRKVFGRVVDCRAPMEEHMLGTICKSERYMPAYML